MTMRRRAFLATATAGLAGFAGCLGATEYRIEEATVAGTAGSLELAVAVEDGSVTVDGPGVLAFTLRNDGDAPVQVGNRGVWPLGVLALAPSLDAGRSTWARLWTDAYTESEYVDANGSAFAVDGEALVRTIAVDDAVTERYEVHGDRLGGPGTYVVREGAPQRGRGETADAVPPLLRYRSADETSWNRFSPEVRVTLAELSLLP